jgi:ketosteroid isomerase-like protein
MKKSLFLLLTSLALFSCKRSDNTKLIEESKVQIVQTEKDFEKMTADKGAAEAFSYFIADSGVIMRRDSIIKGKLSVKNYYKNWKSKNISLKWTPDFVYVASSGDLGYTYGKYTFSSSDSTGAKVESKGHFHTVWKKQADGSWRFVWD